MHNFTPYSVTRRQWVNGLTSIVVRAVRWIRWILVQLPRFSLTLWCLFILCMPLSRLLFILYIDFHYCLSHIFMSLILSTSSWVLSWPHIHKYYLRLIFISFSQPYLHQFVLVTSSSVFVKCSLQNFVEIYILLYLYYYSSLSSTVHHFLLQFCSLFHQPSHFFLLCGPFSPQ